MTKFVFLRLKEKVFEAFAEVLKTGVLTVEVVDIEKGRVTLCLGVEDPETNEKLFEIGTIKLNNGDILRVEDFHNVFNVKIF